MINILIVDDSRFFRSRLKEIFKKVPNLEVIGEATNGKEAVELANKLHPDFITMDIEMPIMDGIMATKEIMQSCPCKIIILSAISFKGAKATIDALNAGALDFMTKDLRELVSSDIKNPKIIEKIKSLSLSQVNNNIKNFTSTNLNKIHKTTNTVIKKNINHHTKIVVIGASTGGPVAIKNILKKLPKEIKMPILIVQHMPASFTLAFAKRLALETGLDIKEAQDGELLKNKIYIAKGGKQMTLVLNDKDEKIIKISENTDEKVSYKPSINITLSSVFKYFKQDILAIILTGMGNDGLKSAKPLATSGGIIWAQNKDTCVIYGMPKAIKEAHLATEILSIDEIARGLSKVIKL